MKIPLKWANYLLQMNKKLFYSILIFFYCLVGSTQRLNVDSNNYASIDSYNGITKSDAFKVWIDGNGTLNLPTWRVSVRVKQPISNGSQIFPADKISLIPTTTYGQFNPNNVPTIAQIGMPLQTFLKQNQEAFLVPQSQAGLYNSAAGGNPYYNLHIPFNLKVEGGAYLSQFTTWSEFTMVLEFVFYNQNNTVLGIQEKHYTLQIATLSGTPPTTNQLSIKIASNAVNGLLELKTKEDYIQGASITYPNALMVSANTNYQLKVMSLHSNFSSAIGNTLPLNIIKLNVIPVTPNAATVFPVTLSSTSQKIASGGTTQGTQVNFNIVYATQSNDLNLLDAKPDQYTTTLQYEIVPQ